MSNRFAFGFPGVGVRLCGHEQGFFERNREQMSPLLDEAADYVGKDIYLWMDDSRGYDLGEKELQLFSYAFNCAVAHTYLYHGFVPAFAAGHSMGIYSALWASGAISFRSGLDFVEKAFVIVAESSRDIDCGMAVVVGLNQKEIDDILKELSESSLYLVNSNNDTTKIFSGLRSDLEKCKEHAMKKSALKARLLPVTSPYHHPRFLEGASEKFEIILRKHSWTSARFPLVSSIDRSLCVEPEDLINFTAHNISTPIDWEKVVYTLIDNGINCIFECGMGISLSQNGRLMVKGPSFVTVKSSLKRVGV